MSGQKIQLLNPQQIGQNSEIRIVENYPKKAAERINTELSESRIRTSLIDDLFMSTIQGGLQKQK